MQKVPRIAAPIALAAALALLATGCTTPDTAAAGATIRTTIDVPATFDPTGSLSLPDHVLARTSYDTLVRKDPAGLVAGLATTWESTPSQAVFTIREGATCSDGTVITPTVVAKSIEYFGRADSGSIIAPLVFGEGNVPVVTADDAAGTVTIDLQVPWPDLVNGMSISSAGIVCPAGLADPEALAAGTAKGSESGPYTLDSFEPGIRYTYKLREDYDAWPAWSTTIDGKPATTLEYLVSPDSTATANLVMSGQLDIAKIQEQTIDRFDGMEGYEIAVNRFSDFSLVFNQREGSPFVDRSLRLAVSQAIDRALLEEVTSLGTGELSTSLASSLTACVPADNAAIPAYDPEAAASALDGVSIRFIGPQIAGPNGAGNEYIAEALRAAGAEVTIENTDVGTWVATIFGEPGAWDMTLYADLNFLGSLVTSLSNFSGAFVEDGGGNYPGVQNATATAALDTLRSGEAGDDPCGLLNEGVNALIENNDVLPLINDAFIYVQRPGFSVQMLGGALDDPIFRISD